MLYIHTTDKVDWLDNWYANVLDIGLPMKILLFTNAETRYCLVHPFDITTWSIFFVCDCKNTRAVIYHCNMRNINSAKRIRARFWAV